jgi:hypothetical protein
MPEATVTFTDAPVNEAESKVMADAAIPPEPVETKPKLATEITVTPVGETRGVTANGIITLALVVLVPAPIVDTVPAADAVKVGK